VPKRKEIYIAHTTSNDPQVVVPNSAGSNGLSAAEMVVVDFILCKGSAGAPAQTFDHFVMDVSQMVVDGAVSSVRHTIVAGDVTVEVYWDSTGIVYFRQLSITAMGVSARFMWY